MKLLIIAVVLAAVQAPPPIPSKTTDDATASRQKIQKLPRNDKAPSPGTVSVPSNENNRAERSKGDGTRVVDRDQPVRISEVPPVSVRRDWIDGLTLFFAGALVIVGAIGIRYAIRTLRAVERQAKANENQLSETQRSTDAAVKSANALMDGDRAWLLVDDVQLPGPLSCLEDQLATSEEPPQPSYFTVRFKKFGKTPATIYAIELRYNICDSDAEPPRSDIFGAYSLAPYERIVPPDGVEVQGGYLEPSKWISRQQYEDVHLMEQFLWAYGIIKYRDAYGRDHETRFCYRYDVPPRAPEHFCLAGPSGFNRAT